MKTIEVIAEAAHTDAIVRLAKQNGATDFWPGPISEDGRQSTRILIGPESRQLLLDALQARLGTSSNARILIYPIEASLPREQTETKGEKSSGSIISREELYNTVAKGAQLDRNYILLVVLSTIVAAIGLIEDNVAVVIGAMVIAPLLGPNIALALGTALGDTGLMWQSFKTNVAGLFIALLLSMAVGWLMPMAMLSEEIMSRTQVGPDGVALALASGAAAVLSLTTGVSSVLVGVMVAVALLPPTSVLGMLLGSGNYSLAGGAALLLAVNIVCVNLAAKLVFLVKGVKPRTWLEKQKARQSLLAYTLFWIVSLGVLLAIMMLTQGLGVAM